jgi:D-alanyl-D-alanine carboxypeptidase
MKSPRPLSSRPTRLRRTLVAVAGVVVLLVALGISAHALVAGGLLPLSAPGSSSERHPTGVGHSDAEGGDGADSSADGRIDAEDGLIPDGAAVTVFDDGTPAISRLDPALLDALRRAATDAAADEDIAFQVNSGWRSAEYQAALREDAVITYGSEEEAARWVSTPETSAHVSGDAIDLGPFDATYWLSQNGAAYGLCQIYGNESWHYELRPDATTSGCPEPYLDPTEDPRMRS